MSGLGRLRVPGWLVPLGAIVGAVLVFLGLRPRKRSQASLERAAALQKALEEAARDRARLEDEHAAETERIRTNLERAQAEAEERHKARTEGATTGSVLTNLAKWTRRRRTGHEPGQGDG